MSSFHKYTFVYIAIVFALLSSPICHAQQALLQITSPASGAVVTEGSTLTINVSADPSVQSVSVLIDGVFPDLQAGSSSNQFLQPIPTTITPGIYHLTAIGAISSGDVESASVAIDIEPQFVPTSISVVSNVFNFTSIGNRLPVHVMGKFVDGSSLDVTRSSNTTYTSNNSQIATVNSSGIVTAVGAGQTAILVQSGTVTTPKYAAVLVTVPQPPPSGTPPIITSVVPQDGIPGSTSVTISGSGFGATQGNGLLLLGTRNAATIASWNDVQIVATIPAGSRNGVVEVGQNGLYSNDVPFTMDVPQIQGMSSSSLVPGIQVTLTGNGFGTTQGQGSVALGPSYPVPVVSWSDTQVVVTVPPGTTPGVARVGQNGVFSNSVNFTMTPAVLSSISPTSLLPGIQATLHGSGFGAIQGQGTVVLGNSYSVPIVSWSDTDIVITVPSGTDPGATQVGQNGVFSNSVNFTMTPPVLSSLSSTSLSPGMQVTLHGSGFGATQGQGSVALSNSYPVSVVSWGDTDITVTVPAGTIPGGAEVGQNGVFSNLVSFTMTPAVLMSISPTVLTIGSQATLHGSGFGASQGQGSVALNNSYPVPVVSWSDTDIVVTVPDGTTAGGAEVGQNGVFSNSISFTM